MVKRSKHQRLASRQQREERSGRSAAESERQVGRLMQEVEERGRMDLSRDSMTLSDISTSSSLFAGE